MDQYCSTMSASTSDIILFVPIETAFKTGDLENVYTFTKYYNKDINTDNRFTSSLLIEKENNLVNLTN